jgi:hypothetical protein
LDFDGFDISYLDFDGKSQYQVGFLRYRNLIENDVAKKKETT